VVAPARAPQPLPHVNAKAKPARFNATTIAGISLMAGSSVGAAIAVGYSVVAVRKNHDSEDRCENDVCTPAGRAKRLDARKAGDIATIAVISTSAVAASGLIAFLVGRYGRKDRRRHDPAKLSAGGFIAPSAGGAAISGSFKS
jgi:hypothetical protein